MLHNYIASYFATAGPNDTMLIIAFSQGTIITRNTLHFYPNEEHKKRIFVLAIAPAAYTDPRNCNMVKHYCHPSDPIPKLDKYGARAFAHTIFNVGTKTPNSFQTYHEFQHPVYRDIIKSHVLNYLKNGYIE